ncbi:hypothetical protein [Saccharothrix sp. HUAS TT10]|uniref:hypothetical protein n=1 Tax=Saccharothrix sp. HUAS TT10 TaxID=3447450 RepID=UPI003F72A04D
MRRVRAGHDVRPQVRGLPWEHAAALPVAVETADRVLGLLGAEPGGTLLLHGASTASSPSPTTPPRSWA